MINHTPQALFPLKVEMSRQECLLCLLCPETLGPAGPATTGRARRKHRLDCPHVVVDVGFAVVSS